MSRDFVWQPRYKLCFLSKMSLFKARDWWATYAGSDEEFDRGCLCVANIDNNSSPFGKQASDFCLLMDHQARFVGTEARDRSIGERVKRTSLRWVYSITQFYFCLNLIGKVCAVFFILLLLVIILWKRKMSLS